MIYFLAYLIGSIQSGVLLSKFFKITDPRYAGSKNFGATNMWRLHGWKFGIITFTLDVFKIWILTILGYHYFNNNQFNILLMSLGTIGHLYPVHCPSKGGKGIACTFMLLFMYKPNLFLITALTWLISYKVTNTSGTSAFIAMLICLILSLTYVSDYNMLCLRLILILCLFKHRNNIKDAITEYQASLL